MEHGCIVYFFIFIMVIAVLKYLFTNKKEIYCGFSMEDYNKIAAILSSNKIRYTYKIVNHDSKINLPTGRMDGFNYMYYIYVNKKGYENAVAVIN